MPGKFKTFFRKKNARFSVAKSEWALPMAVWGAIQAVGSELLFVITTFTFAISNALKLRLMLQGQVYRQLIYFLTKISSLFSLLVSY